MSEYGLDMIDLVLTHLDHHWGYPWWFGTLKSIPVIHFGHFRNAWKSTLFVKLVILGRRPQIQKCKKRNMSKNVSQYVKWPFFIWPPTPTCVWYLRKFMICQYNKLIQTSVHTTTNTRNMGLLSWINEWMNSHFRPWIQFLGGKRLGEKVRVKIKKIKYIHSSPDFRRENNNFLPSQWILLQWKLNFRRKSVCWEKWWSWKRRWRRRRRRWRQR